MADRINSPSVDLSGVDAAIARRQRAEAELEEAMNALYDELRTAMAAPHHQHGLRTELARKTGYTLQHLRRIEGGVRWRHKRSA